MSDESDLVERLREVPPEFSVRIEAAQEIVTLRREAKVAWAESDALRQSLRSAQEELRLARVLADLALSRELSRNLNLTHSDTRWATLVGLVQKMEEQIPMAADSKAGE